VAFLGSSGVGKSTLTNALAGTQAIATQGIRDDDARGRHTTTRRELHAVPGGCLVLDTPGMRELQLTDAASGIANLFQDIEALSDRCRFGNCRHETEPGCAVRAAVVEDQLDPARLARWRKLQAEDAFNSASLTERRTRDRAFGKMVRRVMKEKSRHQP
jgi:ribosome biogenesis GTPase